MTEPLAVAHRVLDLVQAFDVPAAVRCFAPDGILELPNRADGFPTVLQGHERIRRFLGVLPELFTELALVDRVGYRTDVSRTVVMEYRSEGTATTGRPYRNRYVSVFRVGADASIELWREYFDPLAITEALVGATEDRQGGLSLDPTE